MATPIADLSYRNYDGPLEAPIHRWWAIAKATMMLGLRKKWGFWVLAFFAAFPYLFMMVMLYVIELTVQVPLGQTNPALERIVWKDLFLTSFSFSQLWLLLLALLIGIGVIANDNRANALLVYLSKPISRMDYLIGKWVGIFIPLTLVVLAPTLVFYGYCFMSYREYGFVKDDPWLILKLLVMCLVPGAMHASLALGVSSLFRQGRLAGATYAGIFFISLFFTNLIKGIRINMLFHEQKVSSLLDTLYYCSIDGIQIGIAKAVLGTDGALPFPDGRRMAQGQAPVNLTVPAPSGWEFFAALVVLSGISLWIAWTRIRAVEVIG